MTQWLLGTAGILIGTFIVAVGNGDRLRQISLVRRLGWSVVFIAVVLLLVTLVPNLLFPACRPNRLNIASTARKSAQGRPSPKSYDTVLPGLSCSRACHLRAKGSNSHVPSKVLGHPKADS